MISCPGYHHTCVASFVGKTTCLQNLKKTGSARLRHNWRMMRKTLSLGLCQARYDYINDIIGDLRSNPKPHKTTSSRYNVPWLNRSLRWQTRTQQRLYNKAKKSGKSTHWNKFRAARKRLQKNLKSTREKYISDYPGDAIEENPKRFWTYTKQLKKDDPG